LTLVGEFVRSVNFKDMCTGWTCTTAIRNNAAKHIVVAWTASAESTPYLVTGLDLDNGSEFMNYGLLDWAADHKVFFTAAGRIRKATRPPSSPRTTTPCTNTGSTTATTRLSGLCQGFTQVAWVFLPG
jgi:hypothetical protein